MTYYNVSNKKQEMAVCLIFLLSKLETQNCNDFLRDKKHLSVKRTLFEEESSCRNIVYNIL